jgi:hypothetical protein
MAKRGSRGRKAYADLQQVAFTGDGRNMAALSQRRPKDAGWIAWNGDVKLKRNEGRLELVYGGIDQQQEGRYGTQTPVSRETIERVCPGLAF